ncbi:uncharacterized protein LOC106159546 [Lingula anatina]|uniref:Uncharacterized protein LOC106159546 n=1 Tax=Lingula anatina TaxID=7574 RepID=A0A1S3HZ75_LINAN|nr:uncharacterized protein LOC106159546 [Lingula anatina]|eukprot:XP_013391308.1 uncharacterized protein LOC106159546 [Lingula anatina]
MDHGANFWDEISGMFDDLEDINVEVSGDELDTVDGVGLGVNLHTDSPSCYTKRQSGERVELHCTRPRKVNKTFGARFSPIIEADGFYALLTLSGSGLPLIEKTVELVKSCLQKLSKNSKCEILRWNSQRVLLLLPSAASYHALGQDFLDGKLEKCGGPEVNAVKLEVAVLVEPSKCYVTIITTAASTLHVELQSIIQPFSAWFPYALVMEAVMSKGESPPFSAQGPLPTLGISLLFHGNAQAKAERSFQRLSQLPWQQVAVPACMEDITSEGKFYVNSRHGSLLWGVITGANQPGVQITVFVQDQTSFDDMVSFYHKIVKSTPLSKQGSDGVSKYAVFALEPKLELVVAYFHGLKVAAPAAATVLCLQTLQLPPSDLNKLQQISSDLWEAQDPEGNVVQLFTVLE